MNEDALKAFGQDIQKLINKESLDADHTYALFREVLTGAQPDLHQGALLAALVAKGETAAEIAGAWRAIQECDTVEASGPLPDQRCENNSRVADKPREVR